MLFVAETPGGAKPLQGCLEISPAVQLMEPAPEKCERGPQVPRPSIKTG